MIEFAKQIAEKWKISPALSEMLCDAFEKGDTPYYLAEYRPDIAIELPISYLWEIQDFLSDMGDLASKKKRVLNALKKAGRLTADIERRVTFLSGAFELDDILLPLRPNPRSRGQLAIKKGLEPLADILERQIEQDEPIESLAEAYIGKEPSLGSPDDVLSGIKDLLAERLAYDDTVRGMVRDFAYEDGYFDVQPKKGEQARFAQYAGRQIPLSELTKEDILTLLAAEEEKTVRCKLGVPLFRITELLRHHYIHNPDFSGFDLLCEVIDDSWQRLLQPIIERDVKIRLHQEAEAWLTRQLVPELEKKYAEEQRRGVLCIIDAGHARQMHFIVINCHGDLLGATSEKRQPDGTIGSLDRLKQFFLRHRPSEIVICENDQAVAAEAAISKIELQGDPGQPVPLTRFKPEPAAVNPGESEWVKKHYGALLDPEMRRLYGIALMYLQPMELIPLIGPELYAVHPLQRTMQRDRFLCIVNCIVADAGLRKGISLRDIVESPLAGMSCVSTELLQAIRSADAKEPIVTKNDLLKVPGMTEVAFRNIAGFIMLPQADDARDRSLVHPDHYGWLQEAGEQLSISLDTIMSDPEVLRSFATEDVIRKIYIEKKLIAQIRATLRSAVPLLIKSKRKLKLSELKEGSIISGRVTNITPFGVFININAVCDGLVHISQLADEYVESPEQVVALHDKVDVRILTVDVKKRRISLSMKNLGIKGPRVRPSSGQLSTLAEHFKNR